MWPQVQRENNMSKAGKAKTVTRAARRQIVPAIDPGLLSPNNDSGSRERTGKNLLRTLRGVCHHYSSSKIPDFSINTSRLDEWLQQSMNDERTGFLSAFVDQASMIQSNLHYRIVGSKSLVQRTLDLLHASEGGEGFRKLIKMTALNFYCSNFGGAVYLDRTDPVTASYLPNADKWYWNTPPVQAMYATDSTLFRPNGDYVYPYTYDGEPWSRYDFFKVVSMPSTMLKTWGVGRCPLWRCIQIARMTSATYEHIYNTLSPDTAKGIITIKGMTGDEFLAAMSGSEATNEEDEVFKSGFVNGDDLGDIVVLADREDEIVVKFVTLSRLPDGFFIDQWVRWTLTSFATNLGFPLEEFIGMPANRLLGQSGSEVEAGQQRGATKGGREFINQFQEYLQALVIPDSVGFEFADRDEAAELNDVAIKERRAKMVIDLFQATQLAIINKGDENIDTLIESRAAGEHILDREEARRLLVEWDVLPTWITNQPHENMTIDDAMYDVDQARLNRYREWARDKREIQRLAQSPTGEPVILRDSWVDRATGFVRERELTLWEDDADLKRPTNWVGGFPGGVEVAVPPASWKRRTSRKPITLELAQDSDHTKELARIIRKLLLAQVAYLHDDLSMDGFAPMTEMASKKDNDAAVSRLYAVTQLGRDSLLGRSNAPDAALGDIASRNLKYARERWAALLDEGKPPAGVPFRESFDDELRSVVEDTLKDIKPAPAGTAVLDPAMVALAELEDHLRIRAKEWALEEVEFAFGFGRRMTGDVMGIDDPELVAA